MASFIVLLQRFLWCKEMETLSWEAVSYGNVFDPHHLLRPVLCLSLRSIMIKLKNASSRVAGVVLVAPSTNPPDGFSPHTSCPNEHTGESGNTSELSFDECCRGKAVLFKILNWNQVLKSHVLGFKLQIYICIKFATEFSEHKLVVCLCPDETKYGTLV